MVVTRREQRGDGPGTTTRRTQAAMDAGDDGWERLGAGLAEGGGAKEADKRERTIISHR